MDRRLITVIALLSLVILSACGVKVGQSKEQAANLDDAHKGIKGVSINFVNNNPPALVFTGTPLDVIVELKNEGATPVVGGTLYLTGYDTRLFNLQPTSKQFNLDARSRFNLVGGYETADFSSSNVFLPQGAESFSQTLLATACYKYRTEARIPVCIDPNPTSALESEACRVTNPSVGGGQGAPVAVTAVREDAAPGQVGFLITINNQGNGDVIDQFSLGKCPFDLRFNDVDVIQYSASLSGTQGTCQPVTKTRLSNKQGTLYCTFKLANAQGSAYTTVLELNLDYGYVTKTSKTIQIKSIG